MIFYITYNLFLTFVFLFGILLSADENLELLHRVEELQSVDAHCSKLKHDMRLFKIEYERRFNTLHSFLVYSSSTVLICLQYQPILLFAI